MSRAGLASGSFARGSCWAISLLLLMAASACQSLIGLEDRKLDTDAKAGDSGASGKSDAGTASKAERCQKFCKRATEICTGDYAIYHGEGDCVPACELLLSDEQIECRDQQLSAADSSGEFQVHCQAATLGGSTACDGNCENYCAFMDVVCTDKNRKETEKMDCVKKCGGLVDRETSIKGLAADASRYNVDEDHEGDTLQCRLVHLTIAAGPAAADAHCWHAALAPRVGPRGDPNPCATGKSETEPHCEDYCHIAVNACTGADAVYESEEQCLAVCKVLVKGNVADDSGDTVGCRKTHAYNALVVQTQPHCAHSGPGGAGVCGTDCPAYCRMFKAGCDAAFKEAFGSAADATSKCEASCLAQRGANPIADYSVASASAKGANPIACRTLFASRALEHPEQQAMLCKSAAGTAGSSCQ